MTHSAEAVVGDIEETITSVRRQADTAGNIETALWLLSLLVAAALAVWMLLDVDTRSVALRRVWVYGATWFGALCWRHMVTSGLQREALRAETMLRQQAARLFERRGL